MIKISKYSHHLKISKYSLMSNPSLPPAPSIGHHRPAVRYHRSGYVFWNFVELELHSMCGFVWFCPVFFHTSEWFCDSLVLFSISVVHSFLILSHIQWCGCNTMFILSLEHLVVPGFWLVQIKQLWTIECRSLGVFVFIFSG